MALARTVRRAHIQTIAVPGEELVLRPLIGCLLDLTKARWNDEAPLGIGRQHTIDEYLIGSATSTLTPGSPRVAIGHEAVGHLRSCDTRTTQGTYLPWDRNGLTNLIGRIGGREEKLCRTSLVLCHLEGLSLRAGCVDPGACRLLEEGSHIVSPREAVSRQGEVHGEVSPSAGDSLSPSDLLAIGIIEAYEHCSTSE